MNKTQKCFFIYNYAIGESGMSGGDRIFVELAKNWKDKINLAVIASEEAISFCKSNGLAGLQFFKSSGKLGLKNVFTLRALFLNFFKKFFNGTFFVIRNRKLFNTCSYVYSASDFYPDSFPAFLVKLFNPKVKWIAGFYLFAPNPWQKDNPYKGKDFLRGILYWLSQKPIYFLVNRYADIIFVTSQPDQKKFITKKRDASKVFIICGGVDIKESTKYLQGPKVIPVEHRKYDACFVGRFHLQKGILSLLDIWREVVKIKPEAKLAIIGNGPLEGEIKKKIVSYTITNNIDLFSFLDGKEKFDIFKQSKIILHPATYDSGGMAAAEAMAWGLPGVSFDLESLKSYYPRGMVKASIGDIKGFASEILKLLTDKIYYNKVAVEARDLIVRNWDWSRKAEMLYAQIMGAS